ncbi:type II secretion system protein J [Sporosarcina sp. GW1-11]|uniref:PulJ/GspJ family protein n=1 Tax=Sporosarcina sp. GW1-11 TaxID=2899126 RepID=UPI00398622AA
MKNEKGFTLVEVLAALTILGIVFVSFMTIFPQMTNINSKTEAKLETMNLAKRELAFWKDDPLPLEEKEYLKNIKKDTTSKTGYIIYEYEHNEEQSFNYRVTYKIASDLPVTNASDVQLHRIHIEVYKDQRLVSETFGYMEN